MAALWMARAGIRTLVVDRNSGPTEAGHADGLESRTIEILDSFGLGQKVWNESNRTIDISLWVTSPLNILTLLFLTKCTMLEPIPRRVPTKTKYFRQFKAGVVALSGVYLGPISNRDHLTRTGAGV